VPRAKKKKKKGAEKEASAPDEAADASPPPEAAPAEKKEVWITDRHLKQLRELEGFKLTSQEQRLAEALEIKLFDDALAAAKGVRIREFGCGPHIIALRALKHMLQKGKIAQLLQRK